MLNPSSKKDFGERFGVGSTIIKAALQGQAPFISALKGIKPTPAMLLGTAVHAMLSGVKFDEDSLTVPALKKAKAMATKVRMLDLLPQGATLEQVTTIDFMERDGTQFYLKATPDYYHEAESMLVDYKTTKMVAMTEYEVNVTIISSKTYVQLALYNEILFLKTGKKADRVGIYYISNASYDPAEVSCKLVWLDPEWLVKGLEEALEGIDRVKRYLKSDCALERESYVIESLSTPAWLYR